MDLIPLPAGAAMLSAPLVGDNLSLTQLQKQLGRGKMSISTLLSTLLQQIFAPVLITMLLVAIPLNSNGQQGISYPLFTLFTIVYVCIGYPLLLYPFDYAIPGLKNFFRWLPGAIGIVFALVFMIFLWYTDLEKAPFIFVTPPFANWTFIMVTFVFHAFRLRNQKAKAVQSDPSDLSKPLMNEPQSENVTAGVIKVKVSQSVFFVDPTYEMSSTRDALVQFALTFAFECGIMGCFFFCQAISLSFEQATTSSGQLFQYFIFALVVFAFKTYMKIIGLILDGGKLGGISMCYAGEIIGLAFYLLFYRNLFGTLVDVSAFVYIQVSHVVLEALMYPFRMTNLYFRFSQAFLTWVLKPFSKKGAHGADSTLQQMSPKEFQWMVVVEYICRLLITVESLIAYLVTFSFIRYGYNSDHYLFFSSIDSDDYRQVIVFCLVALVIELSCAAFILVIMSRLADFRISRPLKEYASSSQMYWFMIWTVSHITTDIFLQRAKNDFVGK